MSFSRNLLIGTCLAAGLAGCKAAQTNGQPQSSDPVSEQAASASQSLGMLMEASTEAVLGTTSGGVSGRAVGAAVAEPMPDLLSRATSSTSVYLALATVNGHLLFPTGTASGRIDVVTSGTAAPSWPAGDVQLFTGSVTVTLVDVVLTNGNGDSLAIPSGSFSYTLEAVGNKTDDTNWTITLDTLANLATPLAATVTHGSATRSITLSGNRQTHEVLTRVRTVDPVSHLVTANTRTAQYAVSGTVPGTSLSGDATHSAVNYTRWAVTIGDATVAWNRNAALTTKWDYLADPASAFTVVSAHDYTYVVTTIGSLSTRLGPYTALQMAEALRAKLEAAWL